MNLKTAINLNNQRTVSAGMQ